VLTDAHNRPHIEGETKERPMRGAHFVFVSLPLGLGGLASSHWLGYLYYILWQFRAYSVGRRLHGKRPFDLVHHVTYVNSWAPSFMGWLGIPFVWSAGGIEVTPWRFYRALSWRSRVAETRRSLTVKALRAATQYCTASCASVILSSSEAGLWGAGLPVKRFPLGGLSGTEAEVLRSLGASGRTAGPFRIASIGRLEGFKGFGLGLMAFAALLKEVPESEYLIVGVGPERKFLEKQAARLGCGEKVKFLDWMPRASLLNLLSEFDVLVHPSLHEQFGYVLLEAMAAGRPVVCLATGGCGELVSGGGGIAVAVSTPERVATDLCAVLRGLAQDRTRRLRAGQRAREWATEYWNWSRVGERLEAVYEGVLRRPDERVTEAR
jgi:glycosyltransferase involved in cell wall biosynthesis